MRAFLVVVPSPLLDDLPRIADGNEPVLVQALVAELAVEALDIAVLHRFSRLDEVLLHPLRAAPLVQRTPGELRAIVGADLPRSSAFADVYTGTEEFLDAQDAKTKMRQWVGNEPRFHPHVALHDFEAWLLPFWQDIQRLAGSNRNVPGVKPELVNHTNPPSHRLQEVFLTGSKGKSYVKPRDAGRILLNKDLAEAAQACPELKAFLNTLLTTCGAKAVI